MTTPINPQYMASGLVVQEIRLTFNPIYNGVEWVADIASIEAIVTVLLVDDEDPTLTQVKVFPYSALPQMGKNRIDNAKTYFEQRVADSF